MLKLTKISLVINFSKNFDIQVLLIRENLVEMNGRKSFDHQIGEEYLTMRLTVKSWILIPLELSLSSKKSPEEWFYCACRS